MSPGNYLKRFLEVGLLPGTHSYTLLFTAVWLPATEECASCSTGNEKWKDSAPSCARLWAVGKSAQSWLGYLWLWHHSRWGREQCEGKRGREEQGWKKCLECHNRSLFLPSEISAGFWTQRLLMHRQLVKCWVNLTSTSPFKKKTSCCWWSVLNNNKEHNQYSVLRWSWNQSELFYTYCNQLIFICCNKCQTSNYLSCLSKTSKHSIYNHNN